MAFSFGGLGSVPAERKTGTLFGNTAAPAGGLFGQSQQQQQPAQSQPSGGLFGAPAQQSTGGSLFGASQQQQQQQQNQGGSLFGASQQQPQQGLSVSVLGGMALPQPVLPTPLQQQLQQSQQTLPQLRQSSVAPFASASFSGQRERSVKDQMSVVYNKWHPQHPDCAFQFYFYNAVNPDNAPFYGPQQGEDERKWDEALSKKPSPGSIPILYRGFEELAGRIQLQSQAVNQLQIRLHEINNSLMVTKNTHELGIASRITEAKRRHIVFTQRTLALATKVQILRNRGYVMDQAEEELKKKLMELEKKTFDPVLAGRQEEIWARMSSVRERARILEEETEKMGKAIQDQQQNGELLSEEDQKQLQKILKSYDKQLEHLRKAVEEMTKEYAEWEKEKTSTKSGR
ncbi:hypothetical protein P154DRAFT_296345 [Amniculicola lignicola CBS 123094]|uniref:Nucleoporin Nup54 alpha-helical domain-containing protein n=1 Tax=Amniculicola lignicola CBS 123094 TaxID=1392246 RepID=A0A6A5WHR2_9PLEO|nr:hypothetical protein P154DRAFT_296345 [Amniculicola lignicola CBS 123094]